MKPRADTVLVPPANRRVEFSGSGAPSGMMAQLAQGPNRIRASTARPRFGARTRMFEAGFGRSNGWRRPKSPLRRSVRPVGRDEGTREAGGLPGEKTFGVICQRERSCKSHSPQPEGRAKSCRGQGPRVLHGEAMPFRRGTTFSRGMTLAPLTLTLSPKGRGDQSAGHRGLSRAPRLKRCRGKRHKQKPQPQGCGFFIGSTCCQQQDNRP